MQIEHRQRGCSRHGGLSSISHFVHEQECSENVLFAYYEALQSLRISILEMMKKYQSGNFHLEVL